MESNEKDARRVFWWIALLLYLGVIVFFRDPEPSVGPALSEWEVLSNDGRAGLLEKLREMATAAAVEAGWFLPLGVFAALGQQRRSSWLGTLFVVTLPAAFVTLVLVLAISSFEPGRSWTPPAISALSLPALGGLLGVCLGASATRGPLAVLAFFTRLVMLLLASGVALAAGVYLATEEEPLAIERPHHDIDDRRAIVQRFRSNHPLRLRVGETRTVVVPPDELQGLAAWGFSILGGVPRFRLQTDDLGVRVTGSAAIPYLARYANADATVNATVQSGDLELDVRELRLGQIQTPSFLLAILSPMLEYEVEHHETARVVLDGINALSVSDAGLLVAYGRMDPDNGVLPRLLARLGPDEVVLDAARAQLQALGAGGPARGDEAFRLAVASAFDLARARSASGNAVVENGGALLALAAVIGHPRVATLSGLDSERPAVARARQAFSNVSLRGRRDWAQHFFVSAGLTQLSSVAVSDAAGTLKEELDANREAGGSGFSFADLLADRAGTRFARAATSNLASALALQERIAEGFETDALFPSAEGLPEGIDDRSLRIVYGGVGGARYRELSQEIESRLDTCAALR